jgi:hypothetical protein
MHLTRHFAAQAVFYAGLFLMLLGTVFLAGTLTGISHFSLIGSCLFFIIGGLFAVITIKIRDRPVYLFFAVFFVLVGLFFFLSGVKAIPVTVGQGWPLFSVFAGFALIPSGLYHYRAVRIPYLIPALAFIVLGLMLVPFSFKLVSFSFKRFMINWWPLLTVLAGLTLVLLSLGTGHKNGD